MGKIFETDWLASVPVFYNEVNGQASHNINDVIDLAGFEFHPEGFNNYLDFGYSILGQTPIKHVKFLRHSSRLTIHENNKLTIENFDDPVDKWIGKTSHEDEVFHLLQSSVNQWERSVEGEIVIPTSGGYDSRLLNWLIEDKSRIRAFTYGVTEEQSRSHEVVYAAKLSEILGIQWERVPLGNFHNYFEEWHNQFGVATHAHGMYQIEFYKKILPKIHGHNPVLSGIMGGNLSKLLEYEQLHSYSDLVKLSYIGTRGGMRADMTQSQFPATDDIRQRFWDEHREKLQDLFYQVIERIRIKIMLLSYLVSVPQALGFTVKSPYIEPDIARAMLTLPPERRKMRVWQEDFFKKQGIWVDDMGLKGSILNNLNYQAMRRVPLKPLDMKLLREVIKPSYVEWINRHISRKGRLLHAYYSLRRLPDVLAITQRVGIRDMRLEAYCAYLTLKPIETILKKRQALQRS